MIENSNLDNDEIEQQKADNDASVVMTWIVIIWLMAVASCLWMYFPVTVK